jgi:CheY-like chemotaxis protein
VALDRAQGGLGIGLTMVRALIDLHGGRVFAQSPGLGRGSTFVVELPLAAGSPAAEDDAPAASSEHATDGSFRVLVVDDNRDAAESLCTILRLLGHQADVAHDGREALAKIEQLVPELVLLDLGLPELDGFEVARRVIAAGHRPWLVALTGYGAEADRRRSREAGFDEHFVKPLEMKALRGILSRARRHIAAQTSPL